MCLAEGMDDSDTHHRQHLKTRFCIEIPMGTFQNKTWKGGKEGKAGSKRQACWELGSLGG